MADVLVPGSQVDRYKIIELAGDGSQSNVYLAQGDADTSWLIQIEDSTWEPDVPHAHVQQFTWKGGQWVALATDGASMVHLASWVDQLELPFIGWRWATLARQVGYLHNKQVVLQQSAPLALDRLTFNRQGELYITQGGQGLQEYAFPAPDAPGNVTAASDVFGLGASLKALAGDALTRAVATVLGKATHPDPLKRYPNGTVFAEALAEVLPNPAREKVAPIRPKRNAWRWAAAATLGVCIGIAVCGAVAAFLGLAPLPEAAPPPAADERLLVTILRWKMLDGCSARIEATVRDGEEMVTTDDGVAFSAVTPQGRIGALSLAAGAQAAETVLGMGLGDFCEKGGPLTIRAERGDHEGTSTVYYYPGDDDPERVSLYKPGGLLPLIRKGGPSRVYFGISDNFGRAGTLTGIVQVRVLQDGIEVKNPKLLRVDNAEQPLVAVLVMDTSKSMVGDALAKAQDAAVSFIEKLNPQDYVCVYKFSTKVEEPFICSTNKRGAASTIRSFAAGGNTALYDVLTEVGKRHAGRADRQVIVLLSDGADNNSASSLAQGLGSIAATNVPVYAIGLVNQDLAPDVLNQIAASSGGEYLEAPTPDDLTGLYESLLERFGVQYQVEFDGLPTQGNSGTLQLILSDGENEYTIEKEFQTTP